MAAEPHIDAVSVDEYLARERDSEERHEYVDGCMYRMAGGTPDHGIISANVITALRMRLRGSGCRTFTSDVRVRLPETRYFYPDASVSCDERDRGHGDAINSARVIVEVLSPNTEAYDRGRKFAYYRTCPSLQEYVLVNSDRRLLEVFRRTANDLWLLHTFAAGKEVELASIGVRFAVNEVYEDVDVASGGSSD